MAGDHLGMRTVGLGMTLPRQVGLLGPTHAREPSDPLAGLEKPPSPSWAASPSARVDGLGREATQRYLYVPNRTQPNHAGRVLVLRYR